MMLFPAVVTSFPNSKVCVKVRESSFATGGEVSTPHNWNHITIQVNSRWIVDEIYISGEFLHENVSGQF